MTVELVTQDLSIYSDPNVDKIIECVKLYINEDVFFIQEYSSLHYTDKVYTLLAILDSHHPNSDYLLPTIKSDLLVIYDIIFEKVSFKIKKDFTDKTEDASIIICDLINEYKKPITNE